jgi:hypothetical protein
MPKGPKGQKRPAPTLASLPPPAMSLRKAIVQAASDRLVIDPHIKKNRPTLPT